MSTTAGLDIGSSGVKLAIFSGHGKAARLVSFERYDTVGEGVLGDDELYGGISVFLQERTLTKVSLALGVPSYDISMKVSDYPAAGAGDLSRMVAIDASQVGGLSDEVFVYDYVRLPGGLGRQHPVLLCLVHDKVIRPRLAGLESVGLRCSGAYPSVLALAVAGFELIEGLSASAEPAVLLDIGQENTTLVVVAGGQVLHGGSLMAGAAKFAEACVGQGRHGGLQGCHDSLAERLSTVDLSLESARSPLVQAALALESEIQGSLELWRCQELEGLANTPVTRIYITGGGSRLRGLDTWLENKLECQVEAFAPLEHGTPVPEMTVAYGLGLQACGSSGLSLSLLPPDIRTLRLRQKRWPFLAAAAMLLVGGILLGVLVSALGKAAGTAALAEERTALQERVDLAGQLHAMTQKAQAEERMVRELGDSGIRGRRLWQTLQILSRGRMKHGWVIYLADGRTAYEATPFFSCDGKPTSREAIRFDSSEDKQRVTRTVTTEMPPAPQQFVSAGYVPLGHTEEIQGLMALLESQQSLFHGVDRGNSIADASGNLLWTWRAFLNRDAKRLRKGLKLPPAQRGVFADAFELFTLKLPLRDSALPLDSGQKTQ